jgi:type IV pilus assembly protein PilO
LEAEIQKIETAAREITKHRADMAETKLMFTKAAALLPQEQEIPSLLSSISDIGQNSGLDFLSFVPKSEIRHEFYADIPVDIKVRGPYHNVGVFLDKISDLSRIVTVSDISMGSPARQSGEMILDTTFNLVTYRFVEPDPAAKDKQNPATQQPTKK